MFMVSALTPYPPTSPAVSLITNVNLTSYSGGGATPYPPTVFGGTLPYPTQRVSQIQHGAACGLDLDLHDNG